MLSSVTEIIRAIGSRETTSVAGAGDSDGQVTAASAPPDSKPAAAQANLTKTTAQINGPYLIGAEYLSSMPQGDELLVETKKQVDAKLSASNDTERELKERSTAVLYWYKKHFGSSGTVPLFLKTDGVKTVGQYLDTIKQSLDELNPPHRFDLERFGSRDQELNDDVIAAVRTAINEEITMPNGLVVDKKDNQALIDFKESFIKTSPAGREVPIVHVHALKKNTFKDVVTRQNYILISEDKLDRIKEDSSDSNRDYKNYDEGSLQRTKFNLRTYPENFVTWMNLHHARIVRGDEKDPRKAIQKITQDSLNEELQESLAFSDAVVFARAYTGADIDETKEASYIKVAESILNESSFLRRKLDGKSGKDKAQYAKAVVLIYARLAATEHCCEHTPLSSFATMATSMLVKYDADKYGEMEPYIVTAGEEIGRLLGPKIFPKTLTVGEDEPIDEHKRLKWRTWADLTLKGDNKTVDQQKISQFEDQLENDKPFSALVEEHFVNFDSKKPNWQTAV